MQPHVSKPHSWLCRLTIETHYHLYQLRSNRTATELIDTKNTHFEDYNQQALVVR